MLDNRVQGYEDALSHTCKTVEETEDGLNALDTTVNEAKAARENVKWTANRNVKSYGICDEGDQEDTYTTLQTFMEHHLGIKSEEFAQIEFQRLHRIGKPNENSRPRPIISRFLRYGDREFIFSKAKSDDLTAKS